MSIIQTWKKILTSDDLCLPFLNNNNTKRRRWVTKIFLSACYQNCFNYFTYFFVSNSFRKSNSDASVAFSIPKWDLIFNFSLNAKYVLSELFHTSKCLKNSISRLDPKMKLKYLYSFSFMHNLVQINVLIYVACSKVFLFNDS